MCTGGLTRVPTSVLRTCSGLTTLQVLLARLQGMGIVSHYIMMPAKTWRKNRETYTAARIHEQSRMENETAQEERKRPQSRSAQ